MSKRKLKNGKGTGNFIAVTLTSGGVLMLLAFLIFKFMNNGYLSSVQSEIFGVGFALVIIGVVFALFKIKVN